MPSRSVKLAVSLLALPTALGGMFFIVGGPSSGGRFFVRTFFSMWLHESGHAVSAWFCGFFAIVGPWFAPIADERSVWVSVALAIALAVLVFRGVRNGQQNFVRIGCLLLVLQWICVRLPIQQARALTIYFGDAGGMILGTTLMLSFYQIRANIRWGLLVIGAAGFIDPFTMWWYTRKNWDLIPFGTTGITLTDPSKLVDEFKWSVPHMINLYVWLGIGCLCILGVGYAMELRNAYKYEENIN